MPVVTTDADQRVLRRHAEKKVGASSVYARLYLAFLENRGARLSRQDVIDLIEGDSAVWDALVAILEDDMPFGMSK